MSEQTEAAVDREALADWLRSIHFDGTGCGTNGTGGCSNCYGPSPMDAYELAEALVESGPLRDAAAVRHEVQAEVANAFVAWAAKNEIAEPPLHWKRFDEIARRYGGGDDI